MDTFEDLKEKLKAMTEEQQAQVADCG